VELTIQIVDGEPISHRTIAQPKLPSHRTYDESPHRDEGERSQKFVLSEDPGTQDFGAESPACLWKPEALVCS